MKKTSAVTVVMVSVLFASFFFPHRVNPSSPPGLPEYRVKGAQNPFVVITEFSDFECPNCSRAHAYLVELIERHKTDVLLVFRHYPLRMHRWALLAAQAAECAGAQGKFWEYSSRLFERQSEWSKSEDARQLFVQYAESLGLEVSRFTRDLDEGRGRAAIQEDIEAARARNVNVTPTFFLNERRLVGESQLREYGERFLEMEKPR